MSLRFEVVGEHWLKIALGLVNTVWISGLGMLLSTVAGILLVLPLVSRYRWLRLPAQIYVDTARAIPFLMLTYFVYYGLPALGFTLTSWTTAIITLTTYTTGYIAEILRSAWANLPPGQIEAGRAYGFTGPSLLFRIILPQILLASAPVLGNQFIQIIKDSSFLAIITIPELTFVAKEIQSTYYVPFESFIVAALLYWMICLLIERGVSHVESLRNTYAKY